MTVQIVVDEIMGGERVEVTLAKYIGLSLTKKDVQIVKNAVKKKMNNKYTELFKPFYKNLGIGNC